MTTVKSLARRAAPLLLIFALAMALRLRHFADYPKPNQTADEYAWTWAGMTLLATGVPRSWSWLPGYSDAELVQWRGNAYRLVRPWLDHPPLFALAMGAWMRAFKYRDILRANLSAMRVLMLYLFAIQFWLFAALLASVTDRRTTMLALVVLAVCPLAVFDARLVVAENFFVPIYLGIYLMIVRVRRARWLPAAGLLAAALPLSKVAAIPLAIHLALVAWLRGRRAISVAVAAGMCAGIAAFWIYGHHFGPVFAAAIASQSARFAGFGALWSLLFDHKIVEEHAPYLLFVLGLAFVIVESGARATFEWMLLVVVYAGLMTFLADPSMVRGWYLTPLFPALCYGVARAIGTMWDEDGARCKLVWLVLAAVQIAGRLASAHPKSITAIRWGYLGVTAAAGVLLLCDAKLPRRVTRAMTVALVGAPLISDIAFVLSR